MLSYDLAKVSWQFSRPELLGRATHFNHSEQHSGVPSAGAINNGAEAMKIQNRPWVDKYGRKHGCLVWSSRSFAEEEIQGDT
jgi:hypothetical protein